MQIRPRKKSDRGGILCMPRKCNVPEGQPEWKVTKCPRCGMECWKRPLPEGYTEENCAAILCTQCALEISEDEEQERYLAAWSRTHRRKP
nr:alanine racemase [uncultured Sellimonas sp.]